MRSGRRIIVASKSCFFCNKTAAATTNEPFGGSVEVLGLGANQGRFHALGCHRRVRTRASACLRTLEATAQQACSPHANLKQKSRPICDFARSGGLLVLVEARRIELRSILHNPRGSTSLVDDQYSVELGSLTNVAFPSQFNLCSSHTGYVLKRIPLNLCRTSSRGNPEADSLVLLSSHGERRSALSVVLAN